MTLNGYAIAFVLSTLIGGAASKYVFKIEPNLGLLIGAAIGIGISILVLAVK